MPLSAPDSGVCAFCVYSKCIIYRAFLCDANHLTVDKRRDFRLYGDDWNTLEKSTGGKDAQPRWSLDQNRPAPPPQSLSDLPGSVRSSILGNTAKGLLWNMFHPCCTCVGDSRLSSPGARWWENPVCNKSQPRDARRRSLGESESVLWAA
ncbi:hypothetical protein AAFF_G00305940 [Aldrovandia affinis]|uniref:Uncharacterized protein n=1 Tax=Aldrovandia affinis TaxID=143900 RepID=A0AAD7WRI4_9TELE|nr:hypothetical protein AAFF_G00305940 [Aldrovandia affinis]